MSMPLDTLFYFIVFIFVGAVSGSFATAILHRVEEGESWITPPKGKARSQCPNCHHVLGVKDLVPILSFMFQKGKCRYCHQEISKQYIAIEFFSVFLSISIFLFFGLSFVSTILLAALPFLLVQIILWYRRQVISGQLCAIMGVIFLFYFLVQFTDLP